jgi:hypothetical protein
MNGPLFITPRSAWGAGLAHKLPGFQIQNDFSCGSLDFNHEGDGRAVQLAVANRCAVNRSQRHPRRRMAGRCLGQKDRGSDIRPRVP